VSPAPLKHDALVPVQRVLSHLPAVELDETERRAVGHGRSIARIIEGADAVMLLAEGEVVAIATPRGEGLHPGVVLERP
jgi:hypothetical protein